MTGCRLELRLQMRRSIGLGLLGLALVCGCDSTGRPVFMRNPDAALRKETTEFAADAAKRFPYKADAPKGEAKDAPARALVSYAPMNRLDVVNLSDKEYENLELWVNRTHVVFVPLMPGKDKLSPTQIDFKMLYDEKGKPFAITKEVPRVETVELFMNGKMYPVAVQMAD